MAARKGQNCDGGVISETVEEYGKSDVAEPNNSVAVDSNTIYHEPLKLMHKI